MPGGGSATAGSAEATTFGGGGLAGAGLAVGARLSAMKLAGDPNNPLRMREDATESTGRLSDVHGILRR